MVSRGWQAPVTTRFIVGLERHVRLLAVARNSLSPLASGRPLEALMSVDSHLNPVFSKSGTQFDVSIPSQLNQTALRHWRRQDMPMLDTGLRP